MRLIAALLLALVPAVAPAATRTYSVTGFDRIRVNAPYDVVLSVGPAGSARGEGAPIDLDRVRLDVQDRVLTVSFDRSDSYRSSQKVRLMLATPGLIAASVSGAGSLTIDRAKAARFDLSVAGAGHVKLGNLTADRLLTTVLGAGDVTIGGKVAQARVAVQGAGQVSAEALSVTDADVVVTGIGGITLTATRTAKVQSTGMGTVNILGTPACQVQRTGAGEVHCGK